MYSIRQRYYTPYIPFIKSNVDVTVPLPHLSPPYPIPSHLSFLPFPRTIIFFRPFKRSANREKSLENVFFSRVGYFLEDLRHILARYLAYRDVFIFLLMYLRSSYLLYRSFLLLSLSLSPSFIFFLLSSSYFP